MRFFCSILLSLSLVLTGCFGPLNIYSKKEIGRTVDYLGNGIYIIDYPAIQVYSKYGENPRSALPQYLEENELIPKQCSGKIEIVSFGRIENGDGWAEFTCR